MLLSSFSGYACASVHPLLTLASNDVSNNWLLGYAFQRISLKIYKSAIPVKTYTSTNVFYLHTVTLHLPLSELVTTLQRLRVQLNLSPSHYLHPHLPPSVNIQTALRSHHTYHFKLPTILCTIHV
jgi:hypothetical protein